MKKLLIIILILSMVIPMLFSCVSKGKGSNEDTSDTENSTPVVSTPEPVVTPTVTYETWVEEGYEKIVLDKKMPSDASTSISIQMAKNEKEGFHIAFKASETAEGFKVNLVSGGRDDISVEMFKEHHIKTGRKYYPDPIVPFDGTFAVNAKENATILVRFNTESETDAGTYNYKFNITDASGNVVGEYNVELTVWDFALPENFSTDTAVGFYTDLMIAKEKIPGRLEKKYHVYYYEMLLDYGLSAYDLPYDILNEKADAYMSDPRVTSFRVPVTGDDAKQLAYYEKLKSNPEWLEKAYYYPADEPGTLESLDNIEKICGRLKELTPEIRIVIPFFQNITVDNDTDEIDFLDDYLGIWCPKSACWKEKWLADPHNKGYFGDRMDEQKAEGDKIWWYVCWEPGPPFNNLYVDEVGLDHVKLFWQQYQVGSEGFLYWGVNYWKYIDDPWTDMATIQGWLSNDVFGDGSLIYPGKNVDIEGPVASLRMECIRNGLEDVELLKLAEELLGEEWIDEQVLKVSTNITRHEKDNDKFNAVRKAIGEAVEAAVKAK